MQTHPQPHSLAFHGAERIDVRRSWRPYRRRHQGKACPKPSGLALSPMWLALRIHECDHVRFYYCRRTRMQAGVTATGFTFVSEI